MLSGFYFDGLMIANTSVARHTVTRGESLIPFGYLPCFIPDHQVVAQTGMMAGIGGVASGSPIMCGRRRKPLGDKGNADLLGIRVGLKSGLGAALVRTIRASLNLEGGPSPTAIFRSSCYPQRGLQYLVCVWFLSA